MRHGARAMIVLGWLLTPLPVWGASALGFWIGALVARGIASLGWALAVALLLAAACGAAAGVGWLRLLRRLHAQWSRAHAVAVEKPAALDTAAD